MVKLASLVNDLELEAKDTKNLLQLVKNFESAEDIDEMRKARTVLDKHIRDVLKNTKDRKLKSGLGELSNEVQAAFTDAEEASDPAALTTKLASLARQVASGSKAAHALVAVAGNDAAVIMAAKPVSASSKKLLRLRFDKGASPKFFPAQCVCEERTLTFVFEEAATGMARRLRAALNDQANLNLKVRVRGPDGKVETEGDGAEAVTEDQGATGADALAAIRARIDVLKPTILEMQFRPKVASAYQELRAAFRKQDAVACRAALQQLETAIAEPLPQVPNTPQPGARTPPQRPATPSPLRPPTAPAKSTLLTRYTESTLATLAKKVDRGGLKGTGEFGKLIDTAKKLGKAMEPTTDVERSGKQVAVLERFLTNTSEYLRKKGGADGPFKDDIEMTKRKVCADFVAQTRSLLQEKRDAHRALDAAALTRRNGTFKPGNGTSDVRLIKGNDGQVAYAFKSVQGESEMMATPKGFATLREVLMGRLVESIREQSGLEFGWPKASLANLDNEPGALIEGVRGKKIPEDIQIEDVPAEAVQKILLCNLAGGQFDIKWEDVRFQGADNAPVCMDGGAAMPDPMTATTFLYAASDGKPGQQLVEMTDPRTGQPVPTPAAAQRMSRQIVDQFLSIDTAALRERIRNEAHGLEQGVQRSVGLVEGVDTAILSIEGIQQILREANGDISTHDLLNRFQDRVVRQQLIEPNRAKWEQAQRDAFAEMSRAYPGLFKSADEFPDIPTLYREVLTPENRKKLQEFAKLAQPGTIVELMRKHGKPVPTTGFLMAMVEIKAAINKAARAKTTNTAKGTA